MVTTIQLDEETKGRLENRKQGGDSYGDVVIRLLEETEKDEESVREELQELEQRLEQLEESSDVQEESDDVQDESTDVRPVVTDDVDDDRVDVLSEVDVPPAPTAEEFREAAEAVSDLVEEQGTVTRKEAQEQLHDEVPAGYPDNARTWWRKVAKPVLSGHPEVESPKPGASKWRYQR